MAIFDKETIKSWFETNDIPTEEQFSNTWDSFWNKLEAISISAIEGLQNALNSKANLVHNHVSADITDLPPGGGGALTEDITTTISAGGGIGPGVLLETGLTFTDYVKAEHAPYTPPSFSSFAVYGNIVQPLEVGQQMTVQNASYGTVNDSEGNAPSAIKIIGAGFDPDTIIISSPHVSDEPLTAVVSRTTAGTLAWTIQGLDKNLVVRSRAYNTNVFYRFLFGASALRVTNDTEAQTLYNAMQQTFLQAGKAKTVTCTADNENLALFTHIIVVTALGDITNVIQNGAQPVMGAFTKMGDFTITNAHGLSLGISIWTTNSEGAFASGTSLAIS